MRKVSKQFETFANFPYCPDLAKIDADIAILGIPFGSAYESKLPPHSLNAPKVIRRESNRYPDDPIAWDFDLDGTLVGPGRGTVVDCGDLPGSQNNAEENRKTSDTAIRQILNLGSIPVILGGDDSIPIAVMHAYEGQEPFYVLQLDAHIDWRDEVNGIRDGYSSTMRRASEMPWVKGIVQVGARGAGSARESEYQAALDYGARFVISRQFHHEGLNSVLKLIPDSSRCFITMDFDALDPSIMPAVGAPTPGGLYYQETIEFIHAISKRSKIVGVCLVELVPEADFNNLGVITAMRVVWNVIGVLARNNR
ncbi:MAG TPA: arginase family protein [Pelolinea sp.]|nr:arginase family protein [Pelolinea sp.]